MKRRATTGRATTGRATTIKSFTGLFVSFVLFAEQTTTLSCDNGLSFHEEPKLRTVIWDFAGDPLPSRAAHALLSLLETGLSPQLKVLLTPTEQEATLRRAQRVLAQGYFPHDMTGRSYPWPLV